MAEIKGVKAIKSVDDNGSGQFGLNNTSNYYLPQKMLSEDGNKILTNIKKVAAGTIHTLVQAGDFK